MKREKKRKRKGFYFVEGKMFLLKQMAYKFS
jgi:hypothetical protein